MGEDLPQSFGSYTLHDLVARGGMAEIYRATMPGIGGFEKTVAIKKILPHLAENEEFITMLIDEARIIVSINHSNIAQVYDLGRSRTPTTSPWSTSMASTSPDVIKTSRSAASTFRWTTWPT